MNKLEDDRPREVSLGKDFDALVVPFENLSSPYVVSMTRQIIPACIETIVVCPKGDGLNGNEETTQLAEFRRKIGNPKLFMTIHDDEAGAKETMRQAGIRHTVWVSGLNC